MEVYQINCTTVSINGNNSDVNKIKSFLNTYTREQLILMPLSVFIYVSHYTRLYTDLKLKATLHEAKCFYKKFHNNRLSPPSNSLIQNFVLFYNTR